MIGFYYFCGALRHRLFFINMTSFGQQKNCPCNFLLGQDKTIPAVPPGLTLSRSLNAYCHTLTFDYGESSSVSHTPVTRFRSPSKVHSVLRFLPRSHRRRLSERKEAKPTHSFSSVCSVVAMIKTLFFHFVKRILKKFCFFSCGRIVDNSAKIIVCSLSVLFP